MCFPGYSPCFLLPFSLYGSYRQQNRLSSKSLPLELAVGFPHCFGSLSVILLRFELSSLVPGMLKLQVLLQVKSCRCPLQLL